MEKLMRQYCSKMRVKYGSVRFQFDGEEIDPSSTPQALELETDFCIDVLLHWRCFTETWRTWNVAFEEADFFFGVIWYLRVILISSNRKAQLRFWDVKLVCSNGWLFCERYFSGFTIDIHFNCVTNSMWWEVAVHLIFLLNFSGIFSEKSENLIFLTQILRINKSLNF